MGFIVVEALPCGLFSENKMHNVKNKIHISFVKPYQFVILITCTLIKCLTNKLHSFLKMSWGVKIFVFYNLLLIKIPTLSCLKQLWWYIVCIFHTFSNIFGWKKTELYFWQTDNNVMLKKTVCNFTSLKTFSCIQIDMDIIWKQNPLWCSNAFVITWWSLTIYMNVKHFYNFNPTNFYSYIHI